MALSKTKIKRKTLIQISLISFGLLIIFFTYFYTGDKDVSLDKIVEKEIDKYGIQIKKVLSINPGITGLWQVSGRNNLSYKKRVFLDNHYVNNYNLLMDLRIVIRTFGVLFFPMDRGAY